MPQTLSVQTAASDKNSRQQSKKPRKMWPPSLQMMARIGTLFHLEHPHFGGLWEAAVKSVKKHLTRTLTETALCFEEFNTILCQVEALVRFVVKTKIYSAKIEKFHYLLNNLEGEAKKNNIPFASNNK
jgi:hypothetical protein